MDDPTSLPVEITFGLFAADHQPDISTLADLVLKTNYLSVQLIVLTFEKKMKHVKRTTCLTSCPVVLTRISVQFRCTIAKLMRYFFCCMKIIPVFVIMNVQLSLEKINVGFLSELNAKWFQSWTEYSSWYNHTGWLGVKHQLTYWTEYIWLHATFLAPANVNVDVSQMLYWYNMTKLIVPKQSESKLNKCFTFRLLSFTSVIRVFCFQTGELLNCAKGHTKQINDIQTSKDGNWFITASKDFSAKVKMTPTYPPTPTTTSKKITPKYRRQWRILTLEWCDLPGAL